MKLLSWLCLSLNLAVLPGFMTAPAQKPAVDDQVYLNGLYIQMIGNFSREYKEKMDEQAASEEVEAETAGAGNSDDQSQDTADNVVIEEDRSIAEPETVAPETTVSEEVLQPAPEAVTPLYTVNGVMMAEELQTYLYNKLCQAGIGWFFPYAMMMAYQESNCNTYAQNPNGLDKGLYQYRITYWPEFTAEAGVAGDVFNAYTQIDVFVFQMARRSGWGKTVSEMISAHNQSDYGPYCQAYVDQVMQWAEVLVKVR